MKDEDADYFAKILLTRPSDRTCRPIEPSTRNPAVPLLSNRRPARPTHQMNDPDSHRESTDDRSPANFSRKTQKCHQIIERVCYHERREADWFRKVEQATEVKTDAKRTGGITR